MWKRCFWREYSRVKFLGSMFKKCYIFIVITGMSLTKRKAANCTAERPLLSPRRRGPTYVGYYGHGGGEQNLPEAPPRIQLLAQDKGFK